MGHFVALENPSSFRKMAAAMWWRPNDPSIYGNTEVDVTRLLAFKAEYEAREQTKLTVTHLVIRALALALAAHPELNARVRFWGKLERRKTVDLFVQVVSDNGKDLSGQRIAEADKRSLGELAAGLKQAAERIRDHQDAAFQKSKNLLRRLPWWLLRPFLAIASLLTNELNIDLSGSGMPSDPFGTAMVTSLGMYGVDEAYAPMTPIARCMMIVLVPQVRDKVVVEHGQMMVRPMLKLCATFDHRVVDGVNAALLCQKMRTLLLDPSLLA